MLFRSLVSRSGSISGPIVRHVIFLGFGVVLIFVTQLIEMKYIRILGYLGLGFSVLLLIYTLFNGVKQADAARFLEIGGIQFQPSEFARLAILIVAADLIDRFQNKELLKSYFWVFLLLTYIVLILIVTENLSTALILGMVLTAMLFVGDVDWRKIGLFIIIPVVALMFVLLVAKIVPQDNFKDEANLTTSEKLYIKTFGRAYTWIARLENFGVKSDKDQDKYTTVGQYQFAHAQIAIARGGFINMPGSSVQRNYLPEAFSDFIFAIIVEEMGLLGGIFIIFLYMWLLYRAGVVARKCPTVFSAILVIGVTLIIVIQAFIHIGVSVGIVPLTGQPLPLISRGGTSIMINSIYFGIIIAVTRSLNSNNDENTENIEQQEVSEENQTLILEEPEISQQA